MPETTSIPTPEATIDDVVSKDTSKSETDKGSKRTGKKILIVRPSALGDVCKTIPALVTLRQTYPDAQIDWLVRDIFADAIRHHPDLDHVISFPRERFGTMYYNPRAFLQARAWGKQLRAQKYDVVYDLQGLARSSWITRISRAPHRVGYSNARELGWLGYNKRYKVDRNLHTTDRMLGLLEADGLTPAYDLSLHVGPHVKQWLAQWLSKYGAEKYACIAPTARWQSKRWPIENYIEITRRLLQTQVAGPRVVIIATQEELDQVRPLLDEFGRTKKILFPRTTVGQMMALIGRGSLFIGNDSAPLHVATAFGRPITAIFGPTDPEKVGPYGREDAVVEPEDIGSQRKKSYRRQDDQSFIGKVTPDAVWAHALKQLGIDEDPYVPPEPEVEADEEEQGQDSEEQA